METYVQTLEKLKNAESEVYESYSKFWEIKNYLDFLGIETESIINRLRKEVQSYEPFILMKFWGGLMHKYLIFFSNTFCEILAESKQEVRKMFADQIIIKIYEVWDDNIQSLWAW